MANAKSLQNKNREGLPENPKENNWIADRLSKSTAGSANRQSKLDEDIVWSILVTNDRIPSDKWAKWLGVQLLTITNIRKRRSWRHVVVENQR